MYLASFTNTLLLLCLGHFLTAANAAGASSQSNPPDDEVTIVGSSRSNVIRYFNPVDRVWRRQKCGELQLNAAVGDNLQPGPVVKTLGAPLRWTDVEADGSCFYRTLSSWVTGTEEYHVVFRIYVIEIVRLDQRIVSLLGADEHLAHLDWLSKNVWATQTEIVAATLLLNTPIYVYSEETQTWLLFDQYKNPKSPLTTADKCIYIQHVRGNHYNLVTDVQGREKSIADLYPGYMLNPERPTVLDCIIQNAASMRSSQQAEIQYYNPVDGAWQEEKCWKFDVTFFHRFQYNQMAKILRTPKTCTEMIGDNSFFRAVAYWVTGTDIDHQIFRLYVVEELAYNHTLQRLYMGKEFENFKMHNYWAVKIEITAAAVFLNTSIFVYSQTTNTWGLYSKNIVDNAPVDALTEKCIYLSQSSEDQYAVVKDVEDGF
ncbi:uncharacterized protein LOC126840804 [Adelges cooleyi]|uniref:uncharacterized protein LOC126840804 n=1 Tax=Adelges cooleyi TaxID=133065 RepID=UPI002180961C|nr:uncharacterized protein LOC126840804 [Adelges cooleyi]